METRVFKRLNNTTDTVFTWKSSTWFRSHSGAMKEIYPYLFIAFDYWQEIAITETLMLLQSRKLQILPDGKNFEIARRYMH